MGNIESSHQRYPQFHEEYFSHIRGSLLKPKCVDRNNKVNPKSKQELSIELDNKIEATRIRKVNTPSANNRDNNKLDAKDSNTSALEQQLSLGGIGKCKLITNDSKQNSNGLENSKNADKTKNNEQIQPNNLDDKILSFNENEPVYKQVHLPDGSTHQGQWINKLQQGLGSERWGDGATYNGEYLDGKKHGFGQFNWPNGNYYVGEFNEGKRHGIGTYVWQQGNKYTGEWKDNKMHGQGEYIWSDGRIYRGTFNNGKREGTGVFEWGDGRKYQGGFKNGMQHGTGLYFSSKGETQYGIWDNGRHTKWITHENYTL